jgi:hypothetical protein
MKRAKNLLIASTLVVASVVGPAVAQQGRYWNQVRGQRFGQHMVTLHINRVSQIDNLDQGDALGADRADFFAQVWVNGQRFSTKNFSHDDGNPGWIIRAPFRGNTATIRVRLMDDDGGLEEKDDHVDINPIGGMKDLTFVYNVRTGRITGDVSGRRGDWITSRGGGDDDRGRITFSVR